MKDSKKNIPRIFNIMFCLLTGAKKLISIQAHETILDVKKKIQKKFNIDSPTSEIRFLTAGIHISIDDNMTIPELCEKFPASKDAITNKWCVILKVPQIKNEINDEPHVTTQHERRDQVIDAFSICNRKKYSGQSVFLLSSSLISFLGDAIGACLFLSEKNGDLGKNMMIGFSIFFIVSISGYFIYNRLVDKNIMQEKTGTGEKTDESNNKSL